jgi:hypothetical protein
MNRKNISNGDVVCTDYEHTRVWQNGEIGDTTKIGEIDTSDILIYLSQFSKLYCKVLTRYGIGFVDCYHISKI